MKFTFTFSKRVYLLLSFIATLLMCVDSAKAQSYIITGPQILNSSDWEKQPGRWNEWNGGIYDYAGGNYLPDTELISPEITSTELGQKVTINGYNNGGSNSVLKIYYSTDKTNWELAKDLSSNMNATTGSAVDMSADFVVEGNYYIKLVCNKVFIITLKIEEYYAVLTPEMTIYKDEYNTKATNGQTIDFGLVETAPTYKYYVKNTKKGVLTVNIDATGGYTVEPANMSLGAGEMEEVNITAPNGFSEGQVTITGKNGEELISTFNTIFKCTIKQDDHFFVDFEGGKMPEGWITEGWTAYSNASGTENNKGWAGPTNTDVEVRLISPMVEVEEGEPIFFCAFPRYNNSGSLKVEYSDDGENWIVVKTLKYSDFENGKWNKVSVYGVPAGRHKIAINDQEIYFTDFYGYKYAPVPAAIELDETVTPEGLTTGTQDVNLKYTIKEGKWNTIALPFAVNDLSVFGTDVKAYAFTGYENNEIKFNKVESLEAGKPYVMYVGTAAEANGNFTFEGVEITATEASESAFNGAALKATYAPIAKGSMTETWYGITPDGKIMKAGANASIKGFRAYMTLPENTDASSLKMMFDGDATGIYVIENNTKNNDAIYNINGQRVSNATKGIYIINGKKVIK